MVARNKNVENSVQQFEPANHIIEPVETWESSSCGPCHNVADVWTSALAIDGKESMPEDELDDFKLADPCWGSSRVSKH
jgi:hypothetical protein